VRKTIIFPTPNEMMDQEQHRKLMTALYKQVTIKYGNIFTEDHKKENSSR